MIYLHIGLNKAGSTSIQNFLLMNREILREEYNQSYVNSGFSSNAHHKLAWSLGLGNPHHGVELEGKDIYWNALEEEISQNESNNINSIISTEYFYLSKIENIAFIADKIMNFNTKIICYFRPQDKWIESLYSESIKGKVKSDNVWQYYEHQNRYGNCNFNYDDFLKPWVTFFGKQNIIVKLCDSRYLIKKDLLYDFCQTLSISENSALKFHFKKHNESLTPKALVVLKMLNYVSMEHEQYAQLIALVKKNFNKKKNRLLSPTQVSNLIQSWEPLNQKFFEKYLPGIESKNFIVPYVNDNWRNDEKLDLLDLKKLFIEMKNRNLLP